MKLTVKPCALLLAMLGFAASPICLATLTDECLLKQLKSAAPNSTKAQILSACKDEVSGAPAEKETYSLVQGRIAAEKQAANRGFQITAHRPNYLLPIAYNDKPNASPFAADGDDAVDHVESIIQISVKLPLAQNIFDSNTDLIFAYTNKAWWQSFNDEFSKPFRDTNYEPELFLRHYDSFELIGIKLSAIDIGYVHQSNGRSDENNLSRSWDRLFATAIIDVGDDFVLSLKSWYRLPESEQDDEMKNAYQYLGYGELRALYAPNKNTYSAMYRSGTKESAVELTWSYPISENVRVYASYFNGYGESLLDYNEQSDRFGIGFAINDYVIKH